MLKKINLRSKVGCTAHVYSGLARLTQCWIRRNGLFVRRYV